MIFKSRGFPVLLSPRAKAQKIIFRKIFYFITIIQLFYLVGTLGLFRTQFISKGFILIIILNRKKMIIKLN